MAATKYTKAQKEAKDFGFRAQPSSSEVNARFDDVRKGLQAHQHTGTSADTDAATDGNARKITRSELEANVLLIHHRATNTLAVDGNLDTEITTDLDTVEQVFIAPRGTEFRQYTVHSIVNAAGASKFKVRWGFVPASPATFQFDHLALGTKA